MYEATVKVQVESFKNLGTETPSFLRAPTVNIDGSVTYQVQTRSRASVTDLTKELEYLTNVSTIVQTLENMDLSSYPTISNKYTNNENRFINDIIKRIEVTPLKGTDFAHINFYYDDEEFTTTFLSTLIETFEQRLLNIVETERLEEYNKYKQALPIAEKQYEEVLASHNQLDDYSSAKEQELAASLLISREQINTIKRLIDLVSYQISTLTEAVTVLEGPALLENCSKSVNKTLVLAVSLLLGIALGVLTALLVDMIKNTIDTQDFLYRIPEIQNNNYRVESILAYKQENGTLVAENAEIAQQYAYAAAALLFDDKPVKERMFTIASTSEQAGNTFTVANMGLALAKTGKSVLLVDANGDGKNLASYFSLSDTAGFADYVLKDKELNKLVVSVVNNLSVLPFGKANHNEILHHPTLGDKIKSLKKGYDIVLIDSPSFERPVDVISISAHTQGTLLTIRSHRSLRSDLKKILYLFEATKIQILGILFNGTKSPLFKNKSIAASPKEFKSSLSNDK